MQLLKLENKLLPHTLKCSMLSRAILTGEIRTHKFTKILFGYSQFHVWWRSSDDKMCYEIYKKGLLNIV